MKYVCIHGHFYQPPREDPYTEVISRQASASPFENWNEAISFQCYGPNAFSRLLGEQGKIIKIVNNYQHISFNIGPTLLSWLSKHASNVYDAIRTADKKSMEIFGGHGSAIAQVYNHIIMPLASRADKSIQVKWGIRDFEFHYGRLPEGMWLAETAVDTETLEVLAENNIKFTILSPYQAKSIKEQGDQDYKDVTKETLNTHKPYRVDLPSGKHIYLFFYDGDFAHQLSFGDMLKDGGVFYDNIYQKFDHTSSEAEIFNAALDGETFGHHHKHGDMALSYCIEKIINNDQISLINYGQFLDLYETNTLVQIHENTAWSCAHGVERWRSNCGCKTGGDDKWNQEWRKPLRIALDVLNQRADDLFLKFTAPYFENSTIVLEEYIELILDRSYDKAKLFLERHTKKPIEETDVTLLIRLLEMKRNCQLMFTSCGWFFTELSGIETVQVLMYAGRVLQIYGALFEVREVTKEFLSLLKAAKSNIAEHKNGEVIYKKWVTINRKSLDQVAIVNALSQVHRQAVVDLNERAIEIEVLKNKSYDWGYQRLFTGSYMLTSKLTFSRRYFYFSLFQLSRANFVGYYTMAHNPLLKDPLESYNIKNAVKFYNLPTMLDNVKKRYKHTFTLTDLSEEDQFAILNPIADLERSVVQIQLEDIYLRNYPLFKQYKQANRKIPLQLYSILSTFLIDKLKKELSENNFDILNFNQVVDDLRMWSVNIESEKEEINLLASYVISKLVKASIEELQNDNIKIGQEHKIYEVTQVLNKLNALQLNIDFWSSQNTFINYLNANREEILNYRENNNLLYTSLEEVSNYLNIQFNYVLQT